MVILNSVPAHIWAIILAIYVAIAYLFHIYVRLTVKKTKKKKEKSTTTERSKSMVDVDANRNYIKSLLRRTSREGVEKLIAYLDSTDFFTAPASSKYHLNVPGGNALHAMNVYDALDLLNRHYGTPIPQDSVVIIGLLHDVCKVNTYHMKTVEGKRVYKRKDSQPIGHGDKSLYIVSKYINLTAIEEVLIRWHMGPYDSEFQRNFKAIKDIFPYPKMSYLADDIAASITDEMFGGDE